MGAAPVPSPAPASVAQTTPAPATPPSPAPAPQSVAPQPAVAIPQPTPTVASQPTPPPSGQKRLFGARRRVDVAAEATTIAPADSQPKAEDKAFTEEDLQRAWVRFVEQELSPAQILYRNILRPELPTLRGELQAEVSLPPGEAIHTTVMEVYPQLLSFLRTSLQNQQLNLVLREKTIEEQAKVVLTQEDRFNQLAEINPEVRKLKEALHLRFS